MMDGLRLLARKWLIPKPVTHFCGKELYRCQTDQQIIVEHRCPSKDGYAVPHECCFEVHAGHYMKSPVALTLRERVLLWMKIIS